MAKRNGKEKVPVTVLTTSPYSCESCTECHKERPDAKTGECRLDPPGPLGYWPKIKDVHRGWCAHHSAHPIAGGIVYPKEVAAVDFCSPVQCAEPLDPAKGAHAQIQEALRALLECRMSKCATPESAINSSSATMPPGVQTRRLCDHCGKPTANMEDGTFIFCDECRQGNHKQSCDICGTAEGPFETRALHVCADCVIPEHPDLETVLTPLADANEPWVKGYLFRRNGVLCLRLAHDVPNGEGHTLCITRNHVAKVMD